MEISSELIVKTFLTFASLKGMFYFEKFNKKFYPLMLAIFCSKNK